MSSARAIVSLSLIFLLGQGKPSSMELVLVSGSVVWYYLTFTAKKSSASANVATYTAVDDDDGHDNGA
uniref:Putative secreted protein n=1 Tax=Anopheles triannulatus TaxID=58253 RepID=A0A2M4B6J9_9DIPT